MKIKLSSHGVTTYINDNILFWKMISLTFLISNDKNSPNESKMILSTNMRKRGKMLSPTDVHVLTMNILTMWEFDGSTCGKDILKSIVVE